MMLQESEWVKVTDWKLTSADCKCGWALGVYNRTERRKESEREENHEGIDQSSEVLKLPFNLQV